MSERAISQNVSFRGRDKQYRVRFLGGPLDGAEIVTDVQPNSQSFLHRSEGRTYEYRYRIISADCYEARFDYREFTAPKTRRNNLDLFRSACLIALAMFAALLLSIGWILLF